MNVHEGANTPTETLPHIWSSDPEALSHNWQGGVAIMGEAVGRCDVVGVK